MTDVTGIRAGRRVPGEAGLWIIIFGDMLVFGLFFVTFAVYQAQQPLVFARSQATLSQAFGLLNTFLLLTSSWFVALGLEATRSGLARSARRYVGLGMACGLGFVVVKIFEYREKIVQGISPTTDDFFTLYFTFTGIHLLHVVIGLGALLYVFVRCGRPMLSSSDIHIVEGCTIFWHLVDILWVILFALLYLNR